MGHYPTANVGYSRPLFAVNPPIRARRDFSLLASQRAEHRHPLHQPPQPPPHNMSKKGQAAVDQVVKLIVGAGQASPSPPVGPALGSKGVKSMDFCKVWLF